MKITVTKVIRELQEDCGWDKSNLEQHKWIIEPLVKDVLKIIDQKLKEQKGISIK